MAKVSIIIPVYNVEKYLTECLCSVLSQTLKDIEIICVNDGSTDASPDILKSFAERDSRLHIISQENGGYGKAMNVGIDAASGEYIGIVEPDDHIKPDMYETLYKLAVSNELDFIKADFYRFTGDEKSELKLNYNSLSRNKSDYNKVFDPGHTPEALRFIMNTWSGIYKHSFLGEYNIRHTETPGAAFQDNGFWFQTFIYAKRAMIIDRPFYMNRRDNPDSSVHSRDKVYCINQEYDFIREILMRDPALWERFKYMYWFKKYNNYMGTLFRIGEEYREEYVTRFGAELKRGLSRGELSEDVFTKAAWRNLTSIAVDPKDYYITHVHPQTMNQQVMLRMKALSEENLKLRAEIKEVKDSETFRVGKAVTIFPRAIKKLIKKKGKNR